ncbi:MAG: SGNH/GDSL hydrolase family protein [Rhodobacteraceae bacterium]|nr:SGNH/GDSL hydrolase family protein [Paracoccaceae bacterium]
MISCFKIAHTKNRISRPKPVTFHPDIFVRYLLAPLLIAQGLYVRSKALELSEPDGPRKGTAGAGRDLRLLIIGDSAAAGVGAQTQQQALSGQLVSHLKSDFRVHWQLLAKTGRTTADMLEFLQTTGPERFDVVVTVLGVNDVTRGVRRNKWLAQQARLLNLLGTKYSDPLVFMSGVPPMRHFPALPNPLRWVLGCQAHRFDLALEAMIAEKPGCEYVPMRLAPDAAAMAWDGYHPGPLGYQQWSRVIAKRIMAGLSVSPPGRV